MPEQRVKKSLLTRIGVGALIWDNHGRVLLVRHHPDTGWDPEKWFTPGGTIEEAELPEESLKREVKKEVGIEIEEIILNKVNNEVLVHEDIEVDTYFFQFEARAVGQEPTPQEGEILEARWFEVLPENMAFREDYMEEFLKRKE